MEQPTIESIRNAYNVAKESGADNICKVLETLYPDVNFLQKDNRPITERIKTLDDAIAELGDNHKLVKQYFASVEENDDNIVAYQKLRIIAAALNEGWKPRFTNDEHRWFPWFRLYTQEEIDYMDDDEKQELVRFGGNASAGSQSGLGYSNSDYAFSFSNASCGSRLAVKSEELAEYFGKQFIHIWKRLLID